MNITDNITEKKTGKTASFTKRDTKIAKGIAVCLLLVHHLYMGVLPSPMSLFGNQPLVVFATLSKVCVAIFTLLSGYGLAVSYMKRTDSEIAFQKKHLISLMKPYWLVYIVFFALAVFYARPEFTPLAVYGGGIKGILYAACEFFALRPMFTTATINQTWWYMEAALVLYLLFPIIYRLTKKLPYIALPATAVPLVLYTVLGNNRWDTCREIYWLFPFAVGIFIAQLDLFGKFARFSEEKPLASVAVSFAALLIFTLIRAKIGLAADTFFAVSIILFLRATVSKIPFLNKAVEYIGSYSADIFLTHSFFYCYYVSQRVFSKILLNGSVFIQLIAFPMLLFMSLAAAIVLKLVKERLDSIIKARKTKA